MFNSDGLVLFKKLYEGGSFASLAKASGKDRASLYRTYRRLETDLGVVLFQTVKKKLMPTSDADRLYPLVKKFLEGLETYQQSVHSHVEDIEGVIRIGTTPSIEATWLPSFLKEFLDRYPKLNCEIFAIDFSKPLGKNHDVLIGSKVNEEGYESGELFHHEMKLYASQEYLDHHSTPKTFHDLKEHRILAYGTSAKLPYGDLNQHLYLQEETLIPRLYIDSGLGMVRAVEAGLGIGPISGDLGLNLCRGKIINILPKYINSKIINYLSYPKIKANESKIKKLIAFMRERSDYY